MLILNFNYLKDSLRFSKRDTKLKSLEIIRVLIR